MMTSSFARIASISFSTTAKGSSMLCMNTRPIDVDDADRPAVSGLRDVAPRPGTPAG